MFERRRFVLQQGGQGLPRSQALALVLPRWLLLTLVVASTCEAAVWTVKKDGTGHATVIQAAVNMAASGDTVLIYPGRYQEHAPYDFGALTVETYVVVERPNITIMGTDRDSVTIGESEFIQQSGVEPVGISNGIGADGLRVERLTVEKLVHGIVLNASGDIQACNLLGNYIGLANWSAAPSRCAFSHFESTVPGGSGVFSHSDEFQLDFTRFVGREADVIITQSESVLIENCTFEERAYLQFQSQSRGVVRDCKLLSGGRMYFGGSSIVEVYGCIVAAPGPSVAMQISDASEVTARRNVFQGSDEATILLQLGYRALFEENHILHGNGPTLDVRYYGYSGYDLDFRNNWWGTTDSTQIAEWIVDATDDPFRGETVEWWPILSQPVAAENTSLGALKRRFGPD